MYVWIACGIIVLHAVCNKINNNAVSEVIKVLTYTVSLCMKVYGFACATVSLYMQYTHSDWNCVL